MPNEHWKEQSEDQDFPAARAYLSLLVEPSQGKKLIKALERDSVIEHFKAKDLLRASGLPLLPMDDTDVAKDLKRVKFGAKLSPVLLVRGSPLWIVDGYHRVCTSYHLDENAEIPCRMATRGS